MARYYKGKNNIVLKMQNVLIYKQMYAFFGYFSQGIFLLNHSLTYISCNMRSKYVVKFYFNQFNPNYSELLFINTFFKF